MQKVAVVGGGASGFAAAITVARAGGFSVTVYERLQKPLKKLLATGNGRCNLTNLHADASHYRGDIAFAERALARFPAQSTLSFFRSMGLSEEIALVIDSPELVAGLEEHVDSVMESAEEITLDEAEMLKEEKGNAAAYLFTFIGG